jgi:4-hydroxybenzoate polyprenyltransferase
VERALSWLKISRPGLYFQTVWLFVLPLAAGVDLRDPRLWLGLLYVTLPLNLLVYAWNDRVDVEIDRANPRKDSWLFGARATPEELDSALRIAGFLQVLFCGVFWWLDGARMVLWMLAILLVNWAYNAKEKGLRGKPPFDLLNPLGYLLVVQLPIWLLGLPELSWQAWTYLGLFCLQAQLVGEVMDFWPDQESGRVTSVVKMGLLPAKWTIFAVVLVEAWLLWFVFADPVLGGMLGLAALWLLLDLLVLFRSRRYSRTEFTLAGLGMNVAGLISMVWVLAKGTLLHPVWPG